MFVSVLVKISDTTAGYISLMEHFTTPTMKGEVDKKNDPTFLNTLVIVTFSYTEYSVWREYRVGVDQAEGEWR